MPTPSCTNFAGGGALDAARASTSIFYDGRQLLGRRAVPIQSMMGEVRTTFQLKQVKAER
jgi:hypothetical protein